MSKRPKIGCFCAFAHSPPCAFRPGLLGRWLLRRWRSNDAGVLTLRVVRRERREAGNWARVRPGDAKVTVLQELLEWSQDRPTWQRDALRRLVLHGELSDDDIRALTDICKSAHGLAEQQDIVPLTKEHVPDKTEGSAPVSLVSIFHHRGVNALAEDQTLKFGPNLTVVYGDNAAGKTGYIRILKSACRARGQEQILGNVVSGATPLSPVVSIKYKCGPEPEPREWAGSGEDEFISRVSVFDTHCAAVYLTEKTDVAFRPFGLDLFDKLVKACRAVRAKLESEQRALASNALVRRAGANPGRNRRCKAAGEHQLTDKAGVSPDARATVPGGGSPACPAGEVAA